MNNVSIIGRLVRDPEVKKTDGGKTICDLRFAIDDPFSREDRSDFIGITVFGNQGDLCKRYLRKGYIAGVSGRIRSDAYTNSEGVKKYPIKIVADNVQFLQWPDREENQTAENQTAENHDADNQPADYYAAENQTQATLE